jgi:hypothetical protein
MGRSMSIHWDNLLIMRGTGIPWNTHPSKTKDILIKTGESTELLEALLEMLCC